VSVQLHAPDSTAPLTRAKSGVLADLAGTREGHGSYMVDTPNQSMHCMMCRPATASSVALFENPANSSAGYACATGSALSNNGQPHHGSAESELDSAATLLHCRAVLARLAQLFEHLAVLDTSEGMLLELHAWQVGVTPACLCCQGRDGCHRHACRSMAAACQGGMKCESLLS
jgi:hypothetical protein